MPHPFPVAHAIDLFLRPNSDGTAPTAQLAVLPAELLGLIEAKVSPLKQRSIDSARDLLDVALTALDQSLPQEYQRRLLERVDDELANAQRWGELVSNARFCREHPELARQLIGDPESDVASINPVEETGSSPVKRRAARGG